MDFDTVASRGMHATKMIPQVDVVVALLNLHAILAGDAGDITDPNQTEHHSLFEHEG